MKDEHALQMMTLSKSFKYKFELLKNLKIPSSVKIFAADEQTAKRAHKKDCIYAGEF